MSSEDDSPALASCCNSGCKSTKSCLNRALYTECDDYTCGNNHNCNNRLYQRFCGEDVCDWMSERVFTASSKIVPKEEGVFAARIFKEDELIIPFDGELVNGKAFAKRNKSCKAVKHYAMKLNDDNYFLADKASIAGKINHSHRPNCVTTRMLLPESLQTDREKEFIVIWAKSDIGAGEELTFNYNSLESNFECRCVECMQNKDLSPVEKAVVVSGVNNGSNLSKKQLSDTSCVAIGVAGTGTVRDKRICVYPFCSSIANVPDKIIRMPCCIARVHYYCYTKLAKSASSCPACSSLYLRKGFQSLMVTDAELQLLQSATDYSSKVWYFNYTRHVTCLGESFVGVWRTQLQQEIVQFHEIVDKRSVRHDKSRWLELLNIITETTNKLMRHCQQQGDYELKNQKQTTASDTKCGHPQCKRGKEFVGEGIRLECGQWLHTLCYSALVYVLPFYPFCFTKDIADHSIKGNFDDEENEFSRKIHWELALPVIESITKVLSATLHPLSIGKLQQIKRIVERIINFQEMHLVHYPVWFKPTSEICLSMLQNAVN